MTTGFYASSPWGPEPTLLAGPNTGNLMGGAMPAAAPTAVTSSSFNLGGLGMGMSIFGALSGAVGSFYSAKSQASTLRFQSDMSAINARMAESSAQSIQDQGQKQIGQLTMKAGKVKSSQRAAMAANGIALDEGSAVEVQATTDLMKETDALTINANAVMAASAARTQAVNYGNQSLLQGTTASQISPFSAGASSLMTGASAVASSWYRDRRLAAMADKLGIAY